MSQDNSQEAAQTQSESPQEVRPASPLIGKRFVMLSGIGFTILVLAAANPRLIKAAWQEFERIINLRGDLLPASPAKLSEYEIEGLSAMAPRQQAKLLMERAINHYAGAIELIDQNVPGWCGQLEVKKGQLASLLNTAINANDLPVRAAALEITLAGYNLPKTPESVNTLLLRLQNEPEHRAWSTLRISKSC